MTLSLCIIVKNEEQNLPACLKSVKDVVDQMVVLDTGSTDRTVEIAKQWGAQVEYFEWCNDFAIARNESLKYAQGDWILVLDADEHLNPSAINPLKQAITSEDHLVINLIRHEIGATQSPYSLVSRLFRNHPQVQFTRPYHAIIDDSVEALLKHEPHWKIASLPAIAIDHYGYQPSIIAAQNKAERAKLAMEGYLRDHPGDPYTCSKLGALYSQMGEVKLGIELLESALSQDTSDLVKFELYYHLALAYSRLKKFARAIKYYKEAISIEVLLPLKLGAYNNLGNLLQAQGNLGDALLMYQKTIEIDPTFAVGYFNRGMAFKTLGKLDSAIAAYRKAIQYNPQYAQAYQNLGVAYLKGGNVPESLKAFKEAIGLYKGINPQEGERLQQELATMGFTEL
ncbi:tetratricopeptide repeat protein [Roseofilum sp. BLCC_M154]|uniref:Tetratricopeptide repeat protein n=1 Tax=Roseofilum acuticapitatum BLCC-M154 TaxID=3022444 RepID=A0ABT7AUG6_9CYAN|nr:tetratricopeptide repeat protein [Roseofilum acuticapitatum]MDJ1169718.1 tetratricopeptide repeat protein [Roseofilum acuticapitatum BLCC-M154]